MYPFFAMGILFRTYNVFNVIKRHSRVWLAAAIIVFIAMYLLFEPELNFYHFQYMSPRRWIESYLMMFAAGSAGIVICYLASTVISRIERKTITWLNDIGQYTLAIYLEQTVVFSAINMMGLRIHSNILVFFLAAAIFIIVAIVTEIISRNTFLSKYLLGKWNYSQA